MHSTLSLGETPVQNHQIRVFWHNRYQFLGQTLAIAHRFYGTSYSVSCASMNRRLNLDSAQFDK